MPRAKPAAASNATQAESDAATEVLDPPTAPEATQFDNQPFVVMVKRRTVNAHGGELIASAAVPSGHKWDLTYYGGDDWRVTTTRPDGTTDQEWHVQFRRAWNQMTDAWRFFAYTWWSDNSP